MKKLLFLLLLISIPAQADQLVPKWGFEKNAFKSGVGSSDRLWGLEYIHELGPHAMLKLDGGTWIVRDSDRKTSWYLTPSWGYRIKPFKYLIGEAWIGPGWISQPDSRNGSPFQFFHMISSGFTDEGWAVLLYFSHISCAGLCSPNYGRDFAGVRFEIDI